VVEEAFDQFVTEVEPRLRRALVAAYGAQQGREAAAEALAWAWEHWERVREMGNPAGYLYRVGQSRARWARRARRAAAFPPPVDEEMWVEPALPAALESLTAKQRLPVVLVVGFGWTQREVADVCGLRPTTVQNHLERGLAKLRAALGVPVDD